MFCYLSVEVPQEWILEYCWKLSFENLGRRSNFEVTAVFENS